MLLLEEQGPQGKDTGICCFFIARIFQQAEKYPEATAYGRRALQCAELHEGGPDSVEAGKSADELAVTLVLRSVREKDRAIALEALALSRRAGDIFKSTLGDTHKTTM